MHPLGGQFSRQVQAVINQNIYPDLRSSRIFEQDVERWGTNASLIR